MDEFLKVIEVLGIIGVWIMVFWLTKLLTIMKSGVDSQKSIIDSFKTQSEFIDKLQGTVSKLYGPAEIEKIIRVKVESELQKERLRFEKSENDTIESFRAMLSYISISTVYMSDSAIEETIKRIQYFKEGPSLISFVREARHGVLEIRSEAIEELKQNKIVRVS